MPNRQTARRALSGRSDGLLGMATYFTPEDDFPAELAI
jgi:hypothetical protein